MVIIIDTAEGATYHFRLRKEAAKFVGVSLPTFRRWLETPFFFYRTLIIVLTSQDKAEQTARKINGSALSYNEKKRDKVLESLNA